MGAKIQPPNSVETPVKSDFSGMHFPQVGLFSEGNGELRTKGKEAQFSITNGKRAQCCLCAVQAPEAFYFYV